MPAFDHPTIVLATLVGSLVLFVTDALRYDLVALLVVLVLSLTGALGADEAFAGFASEAVVLIAAMYVFGHAFTNSGVAEVIGRRFLTHKGGGELGLVLRITLVAGLLSSVLSNTGVVATLIPVCAGLARTHGVPPSRLLMPMAFGSLLGGLVTVLGTSNNVAINGQLREIGGRPFELFEFTHFGLLLVAGGVLYFLGPGRLLLPRRSVEQSLAERYHVPQFVTEVLVEPNSSLINRAVSDAELFDRHRITVLGIVRAGGESSLMAPGPYNRIRAEDTLILQGTPEDIMSLSAEVPLQRRESVQTAETQLYADDVRLVEAVVPAGSSVVGQTLGEAEFRSRTGLNVLAIAKSGRVQATRIQDAELEVGDTLLVHGHQRDIERARRGREVLVLDEIRARGFGRRAWVSIGLLLGVLALGALTEIPLAVLALAGALGLVLSRAVRVEEVYRIIDWQVIVLIGGMLALGTAFDRHGLSNRVAGWIGDLSQAGFSPTALLVVLLVATVLLTQVLNHVSTAVMMTPVAVELASTLGYESRPFLMAVVTGSSLAFLSPVAHQANAMVMGPGEYKFRDFIKAGAPLTVFMIVLAALLIPALWPLTHTG
jgi:di/tricarboxylate transporter